MRLTSGNASKSRRPRRRGFWRHEGGVAAMEFAILSPMLFFLLIAILEFSIGYFANRMLNANVDRMARMVRTGQAQTAARFQTPGEFKREFCEEPFEDNDNDGNLDPRTRTFSFLFDCSKVFVGVTQVAEFRPNVNDENGDGQIDQNDFAFNPGGRSTINIVRAYYPWPTLLDWRSWLEQRPLAHHDGGATFNAPGWEGNYRIMSAAAAVYTEPY